CAPQAALRRSSPIRRPHPLPESLLPSRLSCLPLLLPAASQVAGPDAVAPGRNDSVGIDRVLDPLVDPAEDVIVETVGRNDLVHEGRWTAVFTPTVLRQDFDQLVDLGPQRYIARILIDRHRDEHHQRAAPAGDRRAEQHDRYVEPPTGFEHDPRTLDDALGRSRDYGRNPDMPVARRVGVASC